MTSAKVEHCRSVFNGSTDHCGSMVACLQYCSFLPVPSNFSSEVTVSLLEKGDWYRDMTDLREFGLLDKAFFVSRQFSEFGERLEIVDVDVTITKSSLRDVALALFALVMTNVEQIMRMPKLTIFQLAQLENIYVVFHLRNPEAPAPAVVRVVVVSDDVTIMNLRQEDAEVFCSELIKAYVSKHGRKASVFSASLICVIRDEQDPRTSISVVQHHNDQILDFYDYLHNLKREKAVDGILEVRQSIKDVYSLAIQGGDALVRQSRSGDLQLGNRRSRDSAVSVSSEKPLDFLPVPMDASLGAQWRQQPRGGERPASSDSRSSASKSIDSQLTRFVAAPLPPPDLSSDRALPPQDPARKMASSLLGASIRSSGGGAAEAGGSDKGVRSVSSVAERGSLSGLPDSVFLFTKDFRAELETAADHDVTNFDDEHEGAADGAGGPSSIEDSAQSLAKRIDAALDSMLADVRASASVDSRGSSRAKPSATASEQQNWEAEEDRRGDSADEGSGFAHGDNDGEDDLENLVDEAANPSGREGEGDSPFNEEMYMEYLRQIKERISAIGDDSDDAGKDDLDQNVAEIEEDEDEEERTREEEEEEEDLPLDEIEEEPALKDDPLRNSRVDPSRADSKPDSLHSTIRSSLSDTQQSQQFARDALATSLSKPNSQLAPAAIVPSPAKPAADSGHQVATTAATHPAFTKSLVSDLLLSDEGEDIFGYVQRAYQAIKTRAMEDAMDTSDTLDLSTQSTGGVAPVFDSHAALSVTASSASVPLHSRPSTASASATDRLVAGNDSLNHDNLRQAAESIERLRMSGTERPPSGAARPFTADSKATMSASVASISNLEEMITAQRQAVAPAPLEAAQSLHETSKSALAPAPVAPQISKSASGEILSATARKSLAMASAVRIGVVFEQFRAICASIEYDYMQEKVKANRARLVMGREAAEVLRKRLRWDEREFKVDPTLFKSEYSAAFGESDRREAAPPAQRARAEKPPPRPSSANAGERERPRPPSRDESSGSPSRKSAMVWQIDLDPKPVKPRPKSTPHIPGFHRQPKEHSQDAKIAASSNHEYGSGNAGSVPHQQHRAQRQQQSPPRRSPVAKSPSASAAAAATGPAAPSPRQPQRPKSPALSPMRSPSAPGIRAVNADAGDAPVASAAGVRAPPALHGGKPQQPSRSSSRGGSRASEHKLSNFAQARNAITSVCLAGAHQEEKRTEVMNLLDYYNAAAKPSTSGPPELPSDALVVEELKGRVTQVVLMFYKSKSLAFKGVYALNPKTRMLDRIFGKGPAALTENDAQIREFMKFETSSKSFKTLPVKSLTSTVDAVIIEAPKMRTPAI